MHLTIFEMAVGCLRKLPWRLVACLALVSALEIHGCVAGERRVQARWDAANEAARQTANKVENRQAAITLKTEVAAIKKEVAIKNVFRDRIVFRDREVPHEIVVKDDAACVIPNRFVSLWNSANRAEIPDAASLLDGGPSGVVLSDVEAQKDRESEICIANTERLKAWQTWAKENLN